MCGHGRAGGLEWLLVWEVRSAGAPAGAAPAAWTLAVLLCTAPDPGVQPCALVTGVFGCSGVKTILMDPEAAITHLHSTSPSTG